MRAFWPFRHFGLKLVSLGIALSLWMIVAGEETVERELRAPLELQQFPPGLELQGEAPSTIDVRVRGASGALGHVSPGDIVGVLDLRGARAGRRLFHLTPEQVRTPFGIDVVQVSPSTVAMVFENSASRSVPIEPDIEGEPAPGYVIGEASVDPATVEIVGPESAVARAPNALTEPVSVDGARELVQESVTVGLLDPALRLKSAPAATVTVKVRPAPGERALRALPVHLRNSGPNLTATAMPSIVSVSLRGNREALDRVGADDLSMYVDLAGLGSGEYTLTVRAEAPHDVGVMHIEPTAVQVRIASAKN
jgi:YbbR domain-containing protein